MTKKELIKLLEGLPEQAEYNMHVQTRITHNTYESKIKICFTDYWNFQIKKEV